MIRCLMAGESHGKALAGIIEGFPAGLEIDVSLIDRDLRRRQCGYGRGGRMSIERDRIEILSGVRHGRSLGSPIFFTIWNRDWENWSKIMSAERLPENEASEGDMRVRTSPRPGHADLAGCVKYGHEDIRNVLERSSARETAVRVAAGAFAKQLLALLGMNIYSHVTAIGRARAERMPVYPEDFRDTVEGSDVRCFDPEAASRMRAEIDKARDAGDTVGGSFQIVVHGLPPGLGSHVHWDRRLDGRIAKALMSIPAIKAVGFGSDLRDVDYLGSRYHDRIYLAAKRPKDFEEAVSKGAFRWPLFRLTNNAGGIEGGMTNGMPLVVNCEMKPIPTLRKPLASFDMRSGEESEACFERSDVCAVPAASIIGEAMVALELASAVTEKFGGDTVRDILKAFDEYVEGIKRAFDSKGADYGG